MLLSGPTPLPTAALLTTESALLSVYVVCELPVNVVTRRYTGAVAWYAARYSLRVTVSASPTGRVSEALRAWPFSLTVVQPIAGGDAALSTPFAFTKVIRQR